MYFLKSNLKYSDMINMTNNCVAVMPHINNIYSISKISKKITKRQTPLYCRDQDSPGTAIFIQLHAMVD